MILVGGTIGASSTILLIIITALAGSILLKTQGFRTLNNIQKSLEMNKPIDSDILEAL